MIKKSAKLYSYKNDELRNKIPSEHLVVVKPKKQRAVLRDFFETNVNLWNKYYDKNEGNPYKHNLNVLKLILKNYRNKKTLLDVGCGTGIPLIKFLKMGFDAKGFDFIDTSVRLTQDNLQKHGYGVNLVFKADIENSSTLPSKKFDIITSVGVFPHIINDKGALRNMKKILNENGLVLLQFKNDLFNLFTLNAYSEDFFKRLIDYRSLPKSLKKDIDIFYKQKLSAQSINSQFGILSKFHNPLTIKNELFEPTGFTVKNIHFFHYHRLPPIFQVNHNKIFRKLGDEMESPNDWKGYLMASSFIVEAQLK